MDLAAWSSPHGAPSMGHAEVAPKVPPGLTLRTPGTLDVCQIRDAGCLRSRRQSPPKPCPESPDAGVRIASGL